MTAGRRDRTGRLGHDYLPSGIRGGGVSPYTQPGMRQVVDRLLTAARRLGWKDGRRPDRPAVVGLIAGERDRRIPEGTAYQRIDVTAQFLRQAALALNLAQGRYNLGLASIIELTQAQLNVTEAEVENLGAKYDYQIQYAALQYALGLLR